MLPETGYGEGKWNVLIENKRIVSITKEMPDSTGADVVDAKGNLLMPGFYNAHTHAAMTLFRGYGEDLPLQRWLDERILPAEDRLNYENVTVATRLAIAEMLKGGTVSFSDMYMFQDAVAETVLEAGMKANLSRALVSFSPEANIATDSRFAEAKALVEKYKAKNGFLPKIIFVKDCGLFGVDYSQKGSETAVALFNDAMKITVYARDFGGIRPMTPELVDFISNWEAESYRSKQ
jgi:cytosine/adenosine deaminase-related metal-dependent hydrolase